MKYSVKPLIMIAVLLLPVSVSAAGDPAAGKAKSAICAACHGPEGISPNDLWPNLAGQKYDYLVKQLKAFKAGDRTEPMMAPMVQPLTDQDINDLAAYFNSLK